MVENESSVTDIKGERVFIRKGRPVMSNSVKRSSHTKTGEHPLDPGIWRPVVTVREWQSRFRGDLLTACIWEVRKSGMLGVTVRFLD